MFGQCDSQMRQFSLHVKSEIHEHIELSTELQESVPSPHGVQPCQLGTLAAAHLSSRLPRKRSATSTSGEVEACSVYGQVSSATVLVRKKKTGHGNDGRADVYNGDGDENNTMIAAADRTVFQRKTITMMIVMITITSRTVDHSSRIRHYDIVFTLTHTSMYTHT